MAALRMIQCRSRAEDQSLASTNPRAENFFSLLSAFPRSPTPFVSPLDNSLETAAESVMHIFTSGTTHIRL